MKRITKFTVLCFAMLFSLSTYAQYSTDLRINEIHPINTDGILDCNGDRCGWVEIFNPAFNSINLSGLYLSNDTNIRHAKDEDGNYDLEKVKNLKKSLIPSDHRVNMPLRSYLVFYFDGDNTKSIFHGNFTLDSTSGVVTLIDINQTTVIDVVEYSNVPKNKSWAKVVDGDTEKWEVANGSPEQENEMIKKTRTSDTFKEHDPYGVGMALIAMFVVMSALVISYLVFKHVSKLYRTDKKPKVAEPAKETVKKPEEPEDGISSEVITAIGLALSLYADEQHDLEDTILTIEKVSKTYSPWSSKCQMMTPKPQRINRK